MTNQTAVPDKSEVIFENAHYVASYMRDGALIVQKKRTGKGFRLVGENAAVWADSIRTAIDKQEAATLCRALCIQ